MYLWATPSQLNGSHEGPRAFKLTTSASSLVSNSNAHELLCGGCTKVKTRSFIFSLKKLFIILCTTSTAISSGSFSGFYRSFLISNKNSIVSNKIETSTINSLPKSIKLYLKFAYLSRAVSSSHSVTEKFDCEIFQLIYK